MVTIKTVADKLEIPISTIRYYEKNGLLDVKRSENSYREYGEDDEEKIKLILVMKYSGFSIKEIKELLSLNNELVLEDDCVDQTNQMILKKKSEMLAKIENYKKVVELLDLMKPIATAKTTVESKLELEEQVSKIYNNTIKEK
ncbi:MerR family transcriptional regulator [Listeria innocua]|uniref:MerR family transcriptional regulator n=1 Tax=Listeria innocua TaxID=1642 RepID=UPI0001EBA203|nr:MerR family transcriptional regulator [Listeria innocua]OET37897.1 MarR family transcriptional regulator [Listeria monocytogenes]EAD5711843.1 MerR family transcriptional regulator [Listeria innocua]EAD5717908.1 MerR family transcriptional regulator [Listeria innocua]EAE2482910.1 MerR family transcriptional regulator [Listeria innocua]EAF5011425.1 MerR family transcriptional regulator [Listeria innocua]